MSLKDRLSAALDATPPENTRRRDTLHAALAAGDNDTDIGAAFSRLIEAREQRAITLDHNGQSEQAAEELKEISSLWELYPEGAPGPAAAKARAAAKPKAKSGALLTRTQMIIAGAAVVVVAIALVVLLRNSDDSDVTAAPASQAITVYKDDHTLGNPKAAITLLEYAAPMCPHCAHFTAEEFPILKREFIDTGRIFYIFRVFPLGAPDGAVEAVARCLPAERYFPYMEMMFREQKQWDPDGYQIADVEAAIVGLAGREGLSPEKAKACINDSAQQERINQSAQDAQLRYQVEGTPTFVMNGQVVNLPAGQKTIDVLRLRINSLLGASSH